MSRPLVVGILRGREPRQAIRDAECELLIVPNRSRLQSRDYPRAPRLFVLESQADEVAENCETVKSLRRDWPLTDVVVWAPQAGGAAVRAYFHAGVRDVVLGRTSARLSEVVRQVIDAQQILPRLEDTARRRQRGSRYESMLSRSPAMWDLFDLCSQVAPASATVLIVGETGTGKELLARAIHRRSGRPGRFVAANCASISSELINSELFGYEKGAFTGASRAQKGLVMHANHGTLFLDEIGDMPVEAQQSLLRMLQEKHIRPVGSRRELPVDVRIVAATHVALDRAMREGLFREDLFYRLDVIRMNVPALRERPEDIVFLFGHFTKQLARHYGLNPPLFADSFFDELAAYDWPGNVRQLQNLSERLVLGRFQRALSGRDFARLCSQSADDATPAVDRDGGEVVDGVTIDPQRTLAEQLGPFVDNVERDYLQAVLQECSGRIGAAADQAGISRRTLLRKLKQHEIDKSEFKPPG